MTSSSLEGIKELFGKGSVIAGKLIVVYLLSNARVIMINNLSGKRAFQIFNALSGKQWLDWPHF